MYENAIIYALLRFFNCCIHLFTDGQCPDCAQNGRLKCSKDSMNPQSSPYDVSDDRIYTRFCPLRIANVRTYSRLMRIFREIVLTQCPNHEVDMAAREMNICPGLPQLCPWPDYVSFIFSISKENANFDLFMGSH